MTDNFPPASEMLHFGYGRRLPVMRQREAGECGLACLAMISAYYGHEDDLVSLSRRFHVSMKGSTLAELIEIAGVLGLSGRPLRLEVEEMSRLQVPCILHWDLNHFVVLQQVTKKGVVIHDPVIGKCKLSWEATGKHFTGVALELSIGPNFQRKKAPPPVSLRALAGSIQGLGKALFIIFSLALALEAFSLLPPQLTQMIIDQVLADDDHDLLAVLGGSFLLLIIMQTGISALRTWAVMWIGTNFNLNWTGNVFQHLLKLPQPYFLKRHLGDIFSRFSAISNIQNTLTTQFVGVIIDGILASVTLAVMVIYSPLLASLIVLALLVYAGLRLVYFQVYRESNLSQIIVTAKQQTQFMEAVRGVQTLRLYNRVPALVARYLNATADVLNTSIAVQRLNLLFTSLNDLTSGMQRVGIIWLGAWFSLKGQFSAGMLVAFISYADQFSKRGYSLVDYAIQFKLLRLQGERLADIVLTEPEPFTKGLYSGLPPDFSMRFNNVSFRYSESDPWVVNNCSFEIKSGESVAITGPSGGGKSTIARLMLGLLDPVYGEILIGGVDIRKLGKDAYRKFVSSVMQDDTLFSGTIADNITFHEYSATIESIENVANLVSLHEDIISMPLGYHTFLGDMGGGLSGGQKQRIFLARALYRKPKILILDEATSQLDVKNEIRINNNISMMSITRISIAHRIETLREADRILFFDKGRIFEKEKMRDVYDEKFVS